MLDFLSLKELFCRIEGQRHVGFFVFKGIIYFSGLRRLLFAPIRMNCGSRRLLLALVLLNDSELALLLFLYGLRKTNENDES